MLPPPAREWHLPTRHICRRVLCYDELPSTLPVAAALAADPAHEGTAVLADVQTAGRGQYGRAWQCPPGAGVLLAVLLSPPSTLHRPAVLTAWAAVAVAETVRQLTGRQPGIKWPNDVQIRGKKVCGILIESAGAVGGPVTAVAGIGLNVNQSTADFAVAGLPDATSLALAAGRSFDTHAVARQLLEQLDRDYTLLLDGDLGTLEACWKWRVGLLGKRVVAEATDGTPHHGRLRELSFAGVELEQADGSVLSLPPEGVRHLWAADRP